MRNLLETLRRLNLELHGDNQNDVVDVIAVERAFPKAGTAQHATLLAGLRLIDEHLNYLHDQGMHSEFIINWLIRNLCVRNQDLVFTLVRKKAEVKKDQHNYVWLGRGKALLYRRDYKTDKTYGEKINELKDRRLLNALGKANFPIIANPANVGYFV